MRNSEGKILENEKRGTLAPPGTVRLTVDTPVSAPQHQSIFNILKCPPLPSCTGNECAQKKCDLSPGPMIKKENKNNKRKRNKIYSYKDGNMILMSHCGSYAHSFVLITHKNKETVNSFT